MVRANVEELCCLSQLPHVRLLQMLQLVLVRGRQVGAHAPIVPGNNDTASSCRLGVVNAVFGMDAGFGAGFAQRVAVLVAPDATNVRDGVRRQHVRGPSGGVLRSAASDHFGVMVL